MPKPKVFPAAPVIMVMDCDCEKGRMVATGEVAQGERGGVLYKHRCTDRHCPNEAMLEATYPRMFWTPVDGTVRSRKGTDGSDNVTGATKWRS